MAEKRLYFGTRERMTWIPCPAINAGLGNSRWIASGGFLNGGAYQRQSTIGAKTYAFSWNPQEADGLYELGGYFDGIHGTGPFYFVDPFAAKTNMLPSFLASPATMAGDAPSFGGTQRVTRTPTGATLLGYPAMSGQLSVSAAFGPYASYTFPVPGGYNLHLGVHGTASGSARVTATPDGGSSVSLPMMSVSSPQRTNTILPGGTWYSVTIAGEGVLTLAGLIGQILPVGETPQPGNFIPGQGNTGVRLSGNPTVTGYSAAITNASIGMTAEFVETGAWEQ